MIYFSILFLLAIQLWVGVEAKNASTTSSMPSFKYKLKHKTINCKKFSCPPIEDPVCVQIKYKGGSKFKEHFYIEMINECEAEYMKCHKDVKYRIVDMTYCQHKDNYANYEFPTIEDKKRIKRHSIIRQEAEEFADNDYDGDDEETALLCPTACPIESTMVCARCNHGIYKTYFSACHIRAYNCRFKNENMELVSHYPCALSGPNDGAQTNIESWAHRPDEDRILKHVICRYRGYLSTVKPTSVDRFCRLYTSEWNNEGNVGE